MTMSSFPMGFISLKQKNKPHHSIHHTKICKHATSYKNLLQTREDMRPKICHFYNARWKYVHLFVKIDKFCSHITMHLQRTFIKLSLFTKFGVLSLSLFFFFLFHLYEKCQKLLILWDIFKKWSFRVIKFSTQLEA